MSSFRGTAHTPTSECYVKRSGEGGGKVVSMNVIISLDFFSFLNGINLLECMCIRSSEEEGKLATKT